jgi:hypothetical protein
MAQDRDQWRTVVNSHQSRNFTFPNVGDVAYFHKTKISNGASQIIFSTDSQDN